MPVFEKIGKPLRKKSTCSKHWWYDFLEKNLEIKDIWKSLPKKKQGSCSQESDDESFEKRGSQSLSIEENEMEEEKFEVSLSYEEKDLFSKLNFSTKTDQVKENSMQIEDETLISINARNNEQKEEKIEFTLNPWVFEDEMRMYKKNSSSEKKE